MIYVADLNCIMLLLDVGLGHEWLHESWVGLGWFCKVIGWVGLGWVGLQKMDPRPYLVQK